MEHFLEKHTPCILPEHTSNFSLFPKLQFSLASKEGKLIGTYNLNVAKILISYNGKTESIETTEDEGYSTMFFLAQLGGQAVRDFQGFSRDKTILCLRLCLRLFMSSSILYTFVMFMTRLKNQR